MIQTDRQTVTERLTTITVAYVIDKVPADSLPGVVELCLARMEEKQRDKALYEAVRKYKGKVHFHKDPVRKKEERTDE